MPSKVELACGSTVPYKHPKHQTLLSKSQLSHWRAWWRLITASPGAGIALSYKRAIAMQLEGRMPGDVKG